MNDKNKEASCQGKNFWKEHSQAWRTSGLTQQEYCDQQGLSHRNFLYQHNWLARQSKQAPIKFVEPKLSAMNGSNHAAMLQLMLPNGIRIGIPPEINESLLKKVLAIAGGLSC
jgi:hypothetical protein